MSEAEAGLMNPLQLAYMGDSIWELIVRTRLLMQRKNVHHMHIQCVEYVNASAQAHLLERIRPILTEKEAAVVQRGRNAHSRHPSPRNQNHADYSEATGFEALLGFLYLTGNTGRLNEIEQIIFDEVKSNA